MAGNSRPLSPSHPSPLSSLLFLSLLVIFIFFQLPLETRGTRCIPSKTGLRVWNFARFSSIFLHGLNFRSRVSVTISRAACLKNKLLIAQNILQKISIDIILGLNLRFLYIFKMIEKFSLILKWVLLFSDCF